MSIGAADTPEASPPRHLLAADRLVAPVAVLDADGLVLYVNDAAARAIGREPEWLIGRQILTLVHRDDRDRLQCELRAVVSGSPSGGVTTYRMRADATSEWRVFESIAENLIDEPTVGGILVSSRDITEERAYERELHNAAYSDALTGLANRTKIADQLAELATDAEALAVAFVGIDRFKLVNDSLGHTVGDRVLKAVAARISSSLPARSIVGRFGGDLFIVIIVGPAAQDATSVLWRIVERVGEPLFTSGHELRVSVSAGVAHQHASATTESLQREAGLALHHAKTQGGGRVETFATEMANAAISRLQLEADLRRGITRSEFSLALQPIVRLRDRTPVQAEALLRWHTDDGLVPPGDFIPVAEETGLIIPLGDWVIDSAARLARVAPGGRLMINLSARQLSAPDLPQRIARTLSARQVRPSDIGFEITETLLIADFDYTVSVLRALRQLGCRVGLDDFGTGYSSLSYLRRLPIDFLKLDGSFSTDIDTDPQANAIAGAIIRMAEALRLEVIAEGVETEAQGRTLHELGCDLAQGYLYGHPAEPT